MQIINIKKIKIILALIVIISISFFIFIMFSKDKKNDNKIYKSSPVTKVAPNNLINKNIIDIKKVENKENNNYLNIVDNKKNTTVNKKENKISNNTSTLKNNNFKKSLNTYTKTSASYKNNFQEQKIKLPQNDKNLFKNLDSYYQQNSQEAKNYFISSFNDNNSSDFLTEFDIAPGTIIPITLITGLNSDLPGEIIGQVSNNIYDTLTHKNILIPKGSRIIAKYDSQISYGQNRILIAWNTIIREDGFILNIPGFQGVDNLGANGYKGRVDKHLSDIFSSAALSSIIDISTSSVLNLTNINSLNKVLESITDTSKNISDDINKKAINRQPTIIINPGVSEKILTNKKITFPPF